MTFGHEGGYGFNADQRSDSNCGISKPPCATNESKHKWKETYYGWECEHCKMLVPHGCEPWMPDDDTDPEDDGYDDD